MSHEYVYSLVHRDKKRGGPLHRLFKRFRKRKQRIAERVYNKAPGHAGTSIETRPAIVEKRERRGDCEADLIVGYRQSGYILSVIDRKSRAVVLRMLERKDKTSVRQQLEVALGKLGGAHTLTVDNGTEFYAHQELSKNAGLPSLLLNGARLDRESQRTRALLSPEALMLQEADPGAIGSNSAKPQPATATLLGLLDAGRSTLRGGKKSAPH